MLLMALDPTDATRDVKPDRCLSGSLTQYNETGEHSVCRLRALSVPGIQARQDYKETNKLHFLVEDGFSVRCKQLGASNCWRLKSTQACPDNPVPIYTSFREAPDVRTVDRHCGQTSPTTLGSVAFLVNMP